MEVVRKSGADERKNAAGKFSQIFLICAVTFNGLPRFKVCITTGNKEIHIIERKPCWISNACPGGNSGVEMFLMRLFPGHDLPFNFSYTF
jgi:hypothetical protein